MTILGYGFVLYAAAGGCVALAFVTTGIDRVLAPASFTPGARLLLLFGAVALLCDAPLAQGHGPHMTRSHRFIHRLLWPALAILAGLGVTMALTLRPPPDPPPAAESAKP
jgi:hypothetical protein